MKHYLLRVIPIIILALFTINSNAETKIKKENKTFSSESVKKSTITDVTTDYLWADTEGKVYNIVLHKYTKGENAGQWTTYIIKTSKKTGKPYKYYLPRGKEIAQDILKDEVYSDLQ